mmetsp:Transcript_48062/g.84225  ORF Transcript_48062/g.84225 Transcript_48062/m.84225 type:complete len:218 (-) Transcript_48062:1417-2070(-)
MATQAGAFVGDGLRIRRAVARRRRRGGFFLSGHLHICDATFRGGAGFGGRGSHGIATHLRNLCLQLLVLGLQRVEGHFQLHNLKLRLAKLFIHTGAQTLQSTHGLNLLVQRSLRALTQLLHVVVRVRQQRGRLGEQALFLLDQQCGLLEFGTLPGGFLTFFVQLRGELRDLLLQALEGHALCLTLHLVHDHLTLAVQTQQASFFGLHQDPPLAAGLR